MEKNSILKIGFLAIGVMLGTSTIQAQTTNDADTQLRLLQAKANDVNSRMKVQATKLNKTYNEVDPMIEERMNDREDSIYITLLSEKRNYELQMEEIKKTQAKQKALTENNTTTTSKNVVVTNIKNTDASSKFKNNVVNQLKSQNKKSTSKKSSKRTKKSK